MERVEESKKLLIEAIQGSSPFQRFAQSKERIEGKEELKHRIDEYRKRCYLLQTSDSTDPTDPLLQGFCRDREILKSDPLIEEYLDSELDLCRMLQRISLEIMNVPDLQIEPFEECIMEDGALS